MNRKNNKTKIEELKPGDAVVFTERQPHRSSYPLSYTSTMEMIVHFNEGQTFFFVKNRLKSGGLAVTLLDPLTGMLSEWDGKTFYDCFTAVRDV